MTEFFRGEVFFICLGEPSGEQSSRAGGARTIHAVKLRIGGYDEHFVSMVPPPSGPIILADDDADDLYFARRSLQKAGASGEILTCADGREVVALLERISTGAHAAPRIVFLDVKMPGLNGFETLKWIREHAWFKTVPVVMLSGSREARDVEMARSLGADDYLVKYPETAELSRVLASAGVPA